MHTVAPTTTVVLPSLELNMNSIRHDRTRARSPFELARNRLVIATAIALSMASTASASAAEDSADMQGVITEEKVGASQDVTDLSTVKVTARKREERMVEVPFAVTAITGEQLEAAGITNVGDAVSLAPGAAAYDAGGGFTYVQVRGASARQGSNETGYYLDDVPFNGVTVPWYPDTRSFDIDAVEVLKGPQGTLFGEGSMGGTVRVITRKPEMDAFRASVETSASSTEGGTSGWGVKAMVNVPLIDGKLAMRFAGTDEETPAWLSNRVTGEDDVNWQRIKTGRAKLRFVPTERLTLDLSYWKYKGHSPAGFDWAYEDMSIDSFYDVHNEWDSGSLTAQYEFDGSQLLYVYSDGGLWRNLSGVIGGTLDYSGTTDIKVRTNEVRWVSTGDRKVDWTIGYYLRTAERNDTTEYEGWDPSNSSYQNDSFSVFGEATWHISQKWAATLGLRYFEDKVDAIDATATQVNELRDTFRKTSPRVSLAYYPNVDTSYYVNVANGYRSGQLQPIYAILAAEQMGLEVPASADPDQLWSYEVGHKAVLAGGRLMLETAVFYSDWKNLPIYMSLAGGAFSALINSAGSTTKGVEMGLTWYPNQAWAFQFGGSYIDAVYKEDQPGTNFHKGTPVFNVPKAQLTGSAAYNWPVGESLKGVARSDVSYFSRRETSASAGDESGDAITRLSARVGLESPKGWSAYLFADNLTNESGAVDAPYLGAATRLRPRTFGIDLKFSY